MKQIVCQNIASTLYLNSRNKFFFYLFYMYLLLLAVHDSMESKVPNWASLAIKLHYRYPDTLSLEKNFSVLQHVDC